jgi:hypothetical protein
MILKRKILFCSLIAVSALFGLCCQPNRTGLSRGFRSTDSTTARQDAIRYGHLEVDAPAEVVYATFNQFCKSYFGVKRDTLYYRQAKKSASEGKPAWVYASERSAVISRETALPSYSYIEYGPGVSYTLKTAVQERPFYLHTHYLTNLLPNSTYHYRFVYVDENGKETRRDEGTFVTRAAQPGTIYISTETGLPPYVLDQENTTYLLTEDIVADGAAFDIRAGGITLDLGGHTVIHASKPLENLRHRDLRNSGAGIRRYGATRLSGLKIYNGTLRQGDAPNNTDYLAGENMLKPDPERMKKLAANLNKGFSNIELEGFDNVEIAGVTGEYYLPQSYSMRFDSCAGVYSIHHNVFLDKGTQMFDRHGAGGARSLVFRPLSSLKQTENQFTVHHNLIKRTRQNAINVASSIYNNEIYVDSWVVNSFAIQPAAQGGRVYNNKMFLSGYYACGILWADKDLLVKDNFIHMEGAKTMISKPLNGRRLIETWGEQDILAGMRITNYGKGGTERSNLRYEGNIILGNARHGSEMRGTEFFSDYSNREIVFSNNIIHVSADDTLSKASCVNTQGAFNDRSKHLPILYTDNTLISNQCNIRFGDDYGQGSNHHFVRCELIRSGNNPAYHTFVFDGGNAVFGHVLLDCAFKDGAGEEDVYWYRTGIASNYSIQQTLQVNARPGTRISIVDRKGNSVVRDTVLSTSKLVVPLTRLIVRPDTWSEGGKDEPINNRREFQSELLTPYTIIAEVNAKTRTKSTTLKTRAERNLKF